MITIIDYGAGNIKSIQNMLKKIGVESIISNDVTEIEQAKKLILPGVGHFDFGMQQLHKSGLIEVLNKKVIEDKTPLLGICLGAQMLGNNSEEGLEKGLGWVNMEVVKFKQKGLKVPHMNWSELNIKKESLLFKGMYKTPRFYFVHSFYMHPENDSDTLCTSQYGADFVAAIEKGNIYGVQFHPEKSHKFGMKLLENFANL